MAVGVYKGKFPYAPWAIAGRRDARRGSWVVAKTRRRKGPIKFINVIDAQTAARDVGLRVDRVGEEFDCEASAIDNHPVFILKAHVEAQGLIKRGCCPRQGRFGTSWFAMPAFPTMEALLA